MRELVALARRYVRDLPAALGRARSQAHAALPQPRQTDSRATSLIGGLSWPPEPVTLPGHACDSGKSRTDPGARRPMAGDREGEGMRKSYREVWKAGELRSLWTARATVSMWSMPSSIVSLSCESTEIV